ncbi:MAG: diacylglycerol kinase family protein [Thermodesulfobacteriota bacterium]|nr:diacylglycerol kinase family protein [Thermodesulfobacteriota bacterium]
MGGIGIVYNPRAGRNNHAPGREETFRRILGDNGVFFRTDDIHALARAVQVFSKEKVDVIAVGGGDGTLHKVLSAVMHVYQDSPLPMFAFLRSGTMNTVPNSIKLKINAASFLTRIVENYKNNRSFETIAQHLMRVNDHVGFLTGAGVVARFLETYYAAPRPGPVHAAGMVTRMIFSAAFRTGYNRALFKPFPCRMTIDGKVMAENKYIYVLGCTVRELGLGFTPTPRAYEKPGCFHLLAGNMTPSDLVPKVPSLWLGKAFSHPRMIYNGIASRVTIDFHERTPWMMDGDLYATARRLTLSVGPTISVIRG